MTIDTKADAEIESREPISISFSRTGAVVRTAAIVDPKKKSDSKKNGQSESDEDSSKSTPATSPMP
jgi:hypothetical protein